MFDVTQQALLNRAVARWNAGRLNEAAGLLGVDSNRTDPEVLFGNPSIRLAVYGSLAPGRSNHHMLAHLRGEWYPVTAHGILHDHGWGAGIGFPAFTWDPTGPAIEMQVFESRDLPGHWNTLDAFEGDDYRRVLIPVIAGGGVRVANVYAAAKR